MPSWPLCGPSADWPGRRGASRTAFPRRTVGTRFTRVPREGSRNPVVYTDARLLSAFVGSAVRTIRSLALESDGPHSGPYRTARHSEFGLVLLLIQAPGAVDQEPADAAGQVHAGEQEEQGAP